MIGSNNFLNVAWTAPSLILGGLYLQGKLGHVASTKFFLLSMIASYGFISAFGPTTRAGSQLNIRAFWPKDMRWDCIADDRSHQMGADVLAGSVLYMCCIYNRYWLLAGAFALFDISYYGPQAAAAPLSAAFTALALL